jgi:hypothetical protein
MQITRGKIPGAYKIGVYGVEGIGKTTFAARFPDPLFIDTENGTAQMDVKRLPRPDAWVELLSEVEWVYNHPDCCKTLVLDTADWAERLCIEAVCAQHQVDGIEAFSYGKGYVYAQEEFGRLLDKLELVRKLGIHIVIVAHAMMRKFEQPEETGAYDRWELKLSKKIAPMVREWVDALVFVNYKVLVVNVDGKGATKGKNKVQGGKRVMYMTHHACWDAKNRFGWPEEAEFDYNVVRGVIEGGAAGGGGATRTSSVSARSAEPPSPTGEGLEKPEQPSALARAVERAAATPAQPTTQQTAAEAAEGPQEAPPGGAGNPSANAPEAGQAASAADVGAMYAGLPDALARMMQEAGVTPDEVRYVIAQKGIYPANTPWAVICGNDQFMKGWLMHPQVWPKVVEMAKQIREDDPF